MTAAELHVVDETEQARVELWRAEELIRAGYEPSDAIALAARHDIDLHRAVELIQQGCPYETAIEILI
jgi:bifunctional DNase/RNase